MLKLLEVLVVAALVAASYWLTTGEPPERTDDLYRLADGWDPEPETLDEWERRKNGRVA